MNSRKEQFYSSVLDSLALNSEPEKQFVETYGQKVDRSLRSPYSSQNDYFSSNREKRARNYYQPSSKKISKKKSKVVDYADEDLTSYPVNYDYYGYYQRNGESMGGTILTGLGNVLSLGSSSSNNGCCDLVVDPFTLLSLMMVIALGTAFLQSQISGIFDLGGRYKRVKRRAQKSEIGKHGLFYFSLNSAIFWRNRQISC